MRHRVLGLHGMDDIEVLQETFSKMAKYLGKIMEHLWKHGKSEYLLQLRECHCYGMCASLPPQQGLNQGVIVLVHDEKQL